MNNRSVISRERIFTGVSAAAAVAAAGLMLAHPAEAFDASLQGLRLWWNILFPALLPFFILCDIVAAYGFAQKAGKWIEPLSRRLFGLPGAAGWPVAAGMLAGSPAGADAAVKLCKRGAVTPEEAERIVALTHFVNPVFMITIVAAVLLRRPEFGPFLLAVHYGAAFLCAMAFRAFGRGPSAPAAAGAYPDASRIAGAPPPRPDGRGFGKVLGDAVTESLQKLLMIGGVVIVFSVLIQLIGVSGLMPDFLQTAAAGVAELHLGAYAAAQAAAWPAPVTAAAVSAVAGWGGLSSHVQVRALLHGTKIRYAPFLAVRMLHAGVAAIGAYLLWEPYFAFFAGGRYAGEAAAITAAAAADAGLWGYYRHWPPLPLLLLAVLLFASVPAVRSALKSGRKGSGNSGGNVRRG